VPHGACAAAAAASLRNPDPLTRVREAARCAPVRPGTQFSGARPSDAHQDRFLA
jgi:hypothetical protein